MSSYVKCREAAYSTAPGRPGSGHARGSSAGSGHAGSRVSWGGRDTAPQTGCLQTMDIYCLTTWRPESKVKVSPSPEAPEETSSRLFRLQVWAVLLSSQGSSSPCLHVVFPLRVSVSVSKFPLLIKTVVMTTSVTTLLPNKVTFTGTGVRTGAYLLGTQFSP